MGYIYGVNKEEGADGCEKLFLEGDYTTIIREKIQGWHQVNSTSMLAQHAKEGYYNLLKVTHKEGLAEIHLSGMQDCCGALLLSNLWISYTKSAKDFLKDIIKLAFVEWDYSQLVYYVVEEHQSEVVKALTEVGFKKVVGLDFCNNRSDNIISMYTYQKEL